MPNALSPEVLAQIFGQSSDDPFLTLLTLSHATLLDDIRLVNNSKAITSRGKVYEAFPFKVKLPVDDGETAREFSLVVDNVGLELITLIRGVTDQIGVKFEMILASIPDVVQMSQADLKITTISYNKTSLTCKIVFDDFLSVALTSEQYNPSNFPGLY